MSADGKVSTFPGVTLPGSPLGEQPSREVIEFLEEILADAKRGKIRAIAVAYVGPGRVTSDGYASDGDSGHDLFAAINDLAFTAARARWERGTARRAFDDPS